MCIRDRYQRRVRESFASPSSLSYEDQSSKSRIGGGRGAIPLQGMLTVPGDGGGGGATRRVPSRRGIDGTTGQVILGATDEEAEAEMIFQQINAGELAINRENEDELALISRYLPDVLNGEGVLLHDSSSPLFSGGGGSAGSSITTGSPKVLFGGGGIRSASVTSIGGSSDVSETPLERLINQSSMSLEPSVKRELAKKLSTLRSSKHAPVSYTHLTLPTKRIV
eukprot:TRINITY_DN21378_c0_g1_i3.p1 TRINITY_DN21378_c0_g1~~TRINITY_DN21378_c0_g1_i3.p1  ORF type:complete len:224 (-),score=30.51 TRINITY_DN21378_c0_g1_i3:136-807(-)